jgi:hypothetical protein
MSDFAILHCMFRLIKMFAHLPVGWPPLQEVATLIQLCKAYELNRFQASYASHCLLAANTLNFRTRSSLKLSNSKIFGMHCRCGKVSLPTFFFKTFKFLLIYINERAISCISKKYCDVYTIVSYNFRNQQSAGTLASSTNVSSAPSPSPRLANALVIMHLLAP